MADLILTIIEVMVIIALSITSEHYVRRAVARIARRAGATFEVVSAIKDALRVVWVVATVSGVLFLTHIANDLQALTIGGLAGLTVSLALQNTLSNILAGLLFFYDSTLRVNDNVFYSGIKGTVIRISLRNTWIKNENDEITIVSNNTLMNGPFTNYSAKERLMRKL